MRTQHRERGAAAVEFALIVPVLLVLVLGIADLGRAYHVQTTLTAAARDGARVMAIQNDFFAARDAARNSFTALGAPASNVKVFVTPTTCASTGTAPPGTAVVTVTSTYAFLGGFLGADVTLSGKGSMRCNG